MTTRLFFFFLGLGVTAAVRGSTRAKPTTTKSPPPTTSSQWWRWNANDIDDEYSLSPLSNRPLWMSAEENYYDDEDEIGRWNGRYHFHYPHHNSRSLQKNKNDEEEVEFEGTFPPTLSPTTAAPTLRPTTLSPTALPTTLPPTAVPTTAAPSTLPPTALGTPTVAPTTATVPTTAPVPAPTAVPVEPPTAVPVEPPTAVPVVPPASAPVAPPVSAAPVAAPVTAAPVTAAPVTPPATPPVATRSIDLSDFTVRLDRSIEQSQVVAIVEQYLMDGMQPFYSDLQDLTVTVTQVVSSRRRQLQTNDDWYEYDMTGAAQIRTDSSVTKDDLQETQQILLSDVGALQRAWDDGDAPAQIQSVTFPAAVDPNGVVAETPRSPESDGMSILVIVAPIVCGLLVLLVVGAVFWRRSKNAYGDDHDNEPPHQQTILPVDMGETEQDKRRQGLVGAAPRHSNRQHLAEDDEDDANEDDELPLPSPHGYVDSLPESPQYSGVLSTLREDDDMDGYSDIAGGVEVDDGGLVMKKGSFSQKAVLKALQSGEDDDDVSRMVYSGDDGSPSHVYTSSYERSYDEDEEPPSLRLSTSTPPRPKGYASSANQSSLLGAHLLGNSTSSSMDYTPTPTSRASSTGGGYHQRPFDEADMDEQDRDTSDLDSLARQLEQAKHRIRNSNVAASGSNRRAVSPRDEEEEDVLAHYLRERRKSRKAPYS